MNLRLARQVEEETAVKVRDGVAVLIDRRFPAEEPLRLTAGVEDRVARMGKRAECGIPCDQYRECQRAVFACVAMHSLLTAP